MQNEFLKRIISSIVLLPSIIFIILSGGIFFNLFILICFILTVFEWFKIEKKKFPYYIGLIFLFFSFFSFYQLRNNFDNNLSYIFLVISICISTDIGGYVFGKLIKGPKLTNLSPNKTISGMFGSYIFAILIILILFHTNFIFKSTGLFSLNNIIFILLLSTVSQVGDITISYFKRKSNIKDTGNIIPGHGGILDRVDGMLFVFPLSYIVFSFNIYSYFQ